MSDDSEENQQETQKKFCAERARLGRAVCRKCKNKLDAGALRLAKYGYNPFGPFPMKMWHHVDCLFEVFAGQKQTTASIETPDDIEGWSDLEEEDQDEILRHLPKCKGWTRKPKSPAKAESTKPEMTKTSKGRHKGKEDSTPPEKESHKDNSFRQFRRLCATLSETESYNEKTAIVRKFFTKGTDGSNFRGDLHLWCRLLLPGIDKRVYNLQSKQLIKIFSKIFSVDHVEMLMDLERGDVAETVSVFFEQSVCVQPAKKSVLSLQDVDKFLEELSDMTKEAEQCPHFKEIAKICTANDLKMIIRLVKHDLRINAGPKHILGAVNPDAYQAFQTSRDLHAVLSKVVEIGDEHSSSSKKSALKITASVMTPILPMLHNNNGDHSKEINCTDSTHNSKKRNADSNHCEDSQPMKKRHTTSNSGDNESQRIDKSCNSDDEDEYTIFGNYVAHEIRSLHSEENRKDLKQIIHKAILDIGELDDKCFQSCINLN